LPGLVWTDSELGPQLVAGGHPEVAEEGRGYGEDLGRALFLGLDEPPGDEVPDVAVGALAAKFHDLGLEDRGLVGDHGQGAQRRLGDVPIRGPHADSLDKAQP